ncbi:hypothetical protein [Bradyrhizobium commune]|uniref:Uncharacterized protein n=1 Tax=Bradyrhizobium commune TaxID=83627 RepID=A0A7S9D8E2_9BRAD|nr:hypothetical protein [Bradyrhizobium commune]QPF92314.1 hypothetical protein IC761_03150 [Bradyrhizobium commune]
MTTLTIENPWPILTATAGLVAFHIGLYTLVGRERKAPFVINDIFPVFLLCLLVAITTTAAFFMPAAWTSYALQVAAAIFLTALVVSLVVVYRTTIRFIYFVDKINLFHLPLVRPLKRFWSLVNPKPNYSNNALPIDADLLRKILSVLSDFGLDLSKNSPANQSLSSIGVQVERLDASRKLLVALSAAFLRHENFVQYVTAANHPIDFIANLQKEMGQDWQARAGNVIAIDAYSSHFAFIDSIYAKKDRDFAGTGARLIQSKRTYAGIHSASSAAFKLFKTNANSESRKPALVIYEFTGALTDLESVEQFRIFLRHVIPSEKLWGGMLTVFVESGLGDNEWRLLKTYVDIAGDVNFLSNPETTMEAGR